MESRIPRPAMALATVFLVVLTDLIGFGIVLPLLPFYAATFKASAIQIGLLYSIYSLAQMIFSPIWGSLSDRYGRRPVMLISTLGAAIAYVVFGLAHALSVLFLSRLIAGVMGGNIATAQAYVADVTPHEDRAKGMGLIGAAFGIGFVAGPALASILIHPTFLDFFGITEGNKFAVPGFFAAFLSFTSFLLVVFKLPETVIQSEPRTEEITRMGIFSGAFWRSILQGKTLFPMFIASAFLLSFSQASLYSTFPLFCSQHLHLSAHQVGMLFVYMGAIAIVIQGILIKTLTQKFGESHLFLAGSIVMVTGFVLIPFATDWQNLMLFLGFLSIGGSLNQPTLNSLISKQADPANVGTAMGSAQGIASLGRVVGPSWGGILYEGWFRLPFLLTASLLSLTVAVGLRLKRHQRI